MYRELISLLDTVFAGGYTGGKMNSQLSSLGCDDGNTPHPNPLPYTTTACRRTPLPPRGEAGSRRGIATACRLDGREQVAKTCVSAKRTGFSFDGKVHLSFRDAVGYAMRNEENESGSFGGKTRTYADGHGPTPTSKDRKWTEWTMRTRWTDVDKQWTTEGDAWRAYFAERLPPCPKVLHETCHLTKRTHFDFEDFFLCISDIHRYL